MGILNSFYEKDLEIMIMENLPTMKERGLPIFYKNTMNQVPLIFDGICDILTWEIVDDKLFIRFIELKRDEVGLDTLSQSIKYYQNSFLLRDSFFNFSHVYADIVLIGSKRSDRLDEFTFLNIENLSIYTYDFNFSGLYFEKIQNSYQCEMSIIKDRIKEGGKLFEKSKILNSLLKTGN